MSGSAPCQGACMCVRAWGCGPAAPQSRALRWRSSAARASKAQPHNIAPEANGKEAPQPWAMSTHVCSPVLRLTFDGINS